jgi:hypothetical protein
VRLRKIVAYAVATPKSVVDLVAQLNALKPPS